MSHITKNNFGLLPYAAALADGVPDVRGILPETYSAPHYNQTPMIIPDVNGVPVDHVFTSGLCHFFRQSFRHLRACPAFCLASGIPFHRRRNK
ncbi:protein of unknown function [Serratia sp. Tan611]|nr:protein of unknown function [Serratia sp. Tan611]